MLSRRELYDLIREIINKNLHRSIKYSIAGYIGFFTVELLTYILFHFLKLPNLIAVIPSFLIGIAIEFLANEFWTTRKEGTHTGSVLGISYRLLKFETVNLLGTSVAVLTQFIIFSLFGITPLIGNIIGSVLSFPINYYAQMKITWQIKIT